MRASSIKNKCLEETQEARLMLRQMQLRIKRKNNLLRLKIPNKLGEKKKENFQRKNLINLRKRKKSKTQKKPKSKEEKKLKMLKLKKKKNQKMLKLK